MLNLNLVISKSLEQMGQRNSQCNKTCFSGKNGQNGQNMAYFDRSYLGYYEPYFGVKSVLDSVY